MILAGRFRLSGWWRWLPVYISPAYSDERRRFRTTIGVAVGCFGRGAYIAYWRR